MNIFYLDHDVSRVAYDLCDKHIVKMIVESAQMLSSVKRMYDGDKNFQLGADDAHLYQMLGKAHIKHPSTQWTMLNTSTYQWHVSLFAAMLTEYERRYARQHSAHTMLDLFEEVPKRLATGQFVDPYPAMKPEYLKLSLSVADRYRTFYCGEKWFFSKWKHNEIPDWYFDFAVKAHSIRQLERIDMIQKIVRREVRSKPDNRVLNLQLMLFKNFNNIDFI